MATTAAQQEFDDLLKDKTRLNYHPVDSPNQPSSNDASFLQDDEKSDDDRPTKKPHQQPNLVDNSRGGYVVPTTHFQSNTGPKGVITDAQEYKAAAAAAKRAANRSPNRGAQMLKDREKEIASVQPYIVSGLGLQHQNKQETSDDEDDEDIPENGTFNNDEFVKKWREQRTRELQTGARLAAKHRPGGRRLHFGGLVPVDGPGFLETVDQSENGTVVVVYIYDPQSEVSDLIEEQVSELARKYVHTRFIKLHYIDAQMDPAGVPAVLAYKNGDKFAGLVPVFNEIPDDADVNVETLERLFDKYQIL